jgi:hypothetical protein
MNRRFSLLLALLGVFVLSFLPGGPARADHLLFCNTPERITTAGAYADYKLEAGELYTVFFHYKNFTESSGPFVVALHGEAKRPLAFTLRQGFADPRRDPPSVGRQAMARYLSAPERQMVGKEGHARFSFNLVPRAVASGVMTVRCDTAARLRIYFRHNQWTVKGARVVAIDAPRQEVEIALTREVKQQYFRIGEPDELQTAHFDGTYGLMYAFRVDAPPGSKVRVAFSPRGGKGGMVGSVGGRLLQSDIIPATHWRVFYEGTVGPGGLLLTTSPFGGVFYPVELLFEML